MSQFIRPISPVRREGPEVMPAFVARHRAFFVLLAVLLAQLLLLSFEITRNQNVRLIQVWAVAVFDPFERSVHWVVSSARQAGREYRGLWQAQEQNEELRQELAVAHSRLQNLGERASEADRLRAMLDLKAHFPLLTVAADVIATDPGEKAIALFVNKGAHAGLSTDLAVISPEGAVGKIIAVFPFSAQIMLITDPSSGVGAMLEKTRVEGVLKGGSENLPKLDYVRADEQVTVGEKVLTSGLDQIYPKGLPVGTVVQVSDAGIYKKILVKPAVALDRLETVLIVLRSVNPELQSAPPAHP